MEKITFNTGRFYAPEGQIIEAEQVGVPLEDLFFADDVEGKESAVIFHDRTRDIKGRIEFCHLKEDDIMRNYDSGNYVQI